jgi:mannose-1-phosphate guanylyltransferase
VKAFLLGGGLGERLRPLTDRLPKCLAPIDGVPLLSIWLDLLERHGVREALLNVSRHADLVERYLANSGSAVNVTLVREAEPLGNAGTLLANHRFVAGEESFFILYTDNLTDVRLDRLAAFHRTHAAPITIGLFRTRVPRASGIVQLGPGGVVTRFEEKPSDPVGDLANAGLYVARQSLFDFIPSGRPIVDFGHDVFPRLVNSMHGCLVEGYLLDIGSPTALALGSQAWAARKATSQGVSGEPFRPDRSG